jgi:Fe-S-cluster containining protein
MNGIDFFNLIGIIFIIFSVYFIKIKPYFSRNKKFKCINCGRCCRLLVRLYDEDIKRIKGKKNYFWSFFGKKYLKIKKLRCVFLKRNGKKYLCSIYNMRPGVCRRYPHTKRFGSDCYDPRCRGLK